MLILKLLLLLLSPSSRILPTILNTGVGQIVTRWQRLLLLLLLLPRINVQLLHPHQCQLVPLLLHLLLLVLHRRLLTLLGRQRLGSRHISCPHGSRVVPGNPARHRVHRKCGARPEAGISRPLQRRDTRLSNAVRSAVIGRSAIRSARSRRSIRPRSWRYVVIRRPRGRRKPLLLVLMRLRWPRIQDRIRSAVRHSRRTAVIVINVTAAVVYNAIKLLLLLLPTPSITALARRMIIITAAATAGILRFISVILRNRRQ